MKRDTELRAQDLTRTQPISQDVLAEKYLKGDETGIEDLFRRVARALASVEKDALRAEWEQKFLDNLHAGALGAACDWCVQPVGGCGQGFGGGGYPGIY